ncbi:hypothetical protein C5E25_21955 [Pectobacterium parmentieri]|nr:hypothetical protein C5E25_21955 [Pectobacterium parmentieri]PWD56949.1 hypothetical protein DF211_21215 [Pectobacterium parmentieri]
MPASITPDYIPVILQVACALATLLDTLACVSPRWGRCKQRSNLPLADLSVTRITYLSKLIGVPSLAALRCSWLSIALKG